MLMKTLIINRMKTMNHGTGFRLRALLVHQVFKKTLFLSPGAQHQFTSGRIFNLVTSDAETLQQLCQNILGVISSPVRITFAVVLLFRELGTASLVALVTLIVMMPIQVCLTYSGDAQNLTALAGPLGSSFLPLACPRTCASL